MITTAKTLLMSGFVCLGICQSALGQTNVQTESQTASADATKAAELMTGWLDVYDVPLAIKDSTITSDKMDLSVVLVRKNGVFEAQKSVFRKIGGDASNESYSTNFGLNSAVAVVGANATAKLDNCGIRTETMGANGIFVNAEGANAQINTLTMMTMLNGSSGLVAGSNGVITAKEVNVTTMGAYSAALSAKSATITLKGGVLKTYGIGSPGIFSSGKVVVEDLIVSSLGSVCAVIDGNHSIELKNTVLNNGAKKAVLLYQSDDVADLSGTSNFLMIGGSLDAQSGTMFYTTNTQYDVMLSGVNILNSSKSTLLLKAATDKWGNKTNNGAQGVVRLKEQDVEGNVDCDKMSSCSLILTDNSNWTGAINEKKTAKNAAVNLDATSTWTLTAACYVQEFTNAKADLSNIVSNGNILFYDAKNPKNAWLEGKTLPLNGGGSAKPF